MWLGAKKSRPEWKSNTSNPYEPAACRDGGANFQPYWPWLTGSKRSLGVREITDTFSPVQGS